MSDTGALSLSAAHYPTESPGRRFIREFFNIFDSIVAFRQRPFPISHMILTSTEFYYDDDEPISAADQILLL